MKKICYLLLILAVLLMFSACESSGDGAIRQSDSYTTGVAGSVSEEDASTDFYYSGTHDDASNADLYTKAPVAPKAAEQPTSAPTQTVNTGTYNYAKHMGTWYFTNYTDFTKEDLKLMTVTDVGNNRTKIVWEGLTDEITFISDDYAVGEPGGLFLEGNKTYRIEYDFYDYSQNGEEQLHVTPVNIETGVPSQGSGGYRTIDDFFNW